MAVEKLYMSVAEACERYGICRASLYKLFVLDGCPTLRKFGGKTLIPTADFDRFFEEQLTEPSIAGMDRRPEQLKLYR